MRQTPCCKFTWVKGPGPIHWNEYNNEVQCHNCGSIFGRFTVATPRLEEGQPASNPPVQSNLADKYERLAERVLGWSRHSGGWRPGDTYEDPAGAGIILCDDWAPDTDISSSHTLLLACTVRYGPITIEQVSENWFCASFKLPSSSNMYAQHAETIEQALFELALKLCEDDELNEPQTTSTM